MGVVSLVQSLQHGEPKGGDLAMRVWLSALMVVVACSANAFGQEDKKTDDLKPADPDTGESTVEEETLGLLPNSFAKQGIKFSVTYIGEALGNPTGGAKQSAVYEDRINFAADVDLEKLFGLKQLTFHANVFQIDGGGLSRGALLNLLDVSGIEALPTTRLYEIWFEQKWGTKLALRAGQLAADTEFMTAKYTDVFTNASLGWPAGLSVNMPSGGPSPPLATVGARLRADITDNFSLLGAIFDGDAAGPGSNDPQLRDRYGVNFRVNDPPLAIAESQILWNAKKGDPGLDGKFKVGGWHHFGTFSNERLTASASRLRAPLRTGSRLPCPEISAFIPSSSRNSIGWDTTTTAASAFLCVPLTAPRIATWSISTPTRESNS
jgi:porin